MPMESFLYSEGKLSKKNGVSVADDVDVKLVKNSIVILFKEVFYELADFKVYCTKNVGYPCCLSPNRILMQ